MERRLTVGGDVGTFVGAVGAKVPLEVGGCVGDRVGVVGCCVGSFVGRCVGISVGGDVVGDRVCDGRRADRGGGFGSAAGDADRGAADQAAAGGHLVRSGDPAAVAGLGLKPPSRALHFAQARGGAFKFKRA